MPKLFGEEGGSKDFDERRMGFFDISAIDGTNNKVYDTLGIEGLLDLL